MKKAVLAASALVLALALGWLAGSILPLPLSRTGLEAGGAPRPAPLPAAVLAPVSDRLLAAVPDVRQSTGYTCGAAALQAVLAYWGTSEREDRLAARLRSTPDAGTHPEDILRVAREFGLTAELREGLDLPDLERALAEGATVIVDLQAWREDQARSWAETWDDGHYMVLLGMDRDALYFEDPSLLGARGVIPRTEFVERWHDYEGQPPLDPSDRRYVRMALFIRGARPPAGAPPVFERVL